MANNYSTHSCDICGNEFNRILNKNGSTRKTKYNLCSQQCKTRARVVRNNPNAIKRGGQQKPLCTCLGCGKEYINKRRNAGEGTKYCSRGCAFADTGRHQAIAKARIGWRKYPDAPGPQCKIFFSVCADCGKPFTTRWEKQLTCSDECAYRHMLSRKREEYEPKEPSDKPCATCGETFSTNKPSALYCSPRCIPKKNNHNSRARHAGVAYEPVNTMRVLERDGWRCQICGKATPRERRGTRYSNAPELDHRVPFALGGPHTYDNVQCACRSCNAMKGGTLIVGQISLFNQQHTGR